MLLLSFESNNRLYGKTLNPINHDRVPGSSSGGCTGLVACDATSLSLKTDIGESIRAQASFCKVYGFRALANRVTKILFLLVIAIFI